MEVRIQALIPKVRLQEPSVFIGEVGLKAVGRQQAHAVVINGNLASERVILAFEW
jgi:hypothetical protein